MSTLNLSSEELVKLVTRLVVEELSIRSLEIPMGISNRHVHLNRADMDILFGKGSELTKLKDLKQPGQYAAAEVITIKGPRGKIEKVRVLGPLREETQVEISLSDSFPLGIKAPIRESGILKNTPGLELIGPKGSVEKSYGTIVAARHIHMTPELAKQIGVKDKDIVDVEIGNGRGALLKNVLLRVSEKFALEMHLDIDEANAVNIKNDEMVKIVR